MGSIAPAALERRACVALSPERYARFRPVIRRLAVRLARWVPGDDAVGDLVSVGWLGLLDAQRRAGGALGEDFDAYARHRVRSAMLDWVRALDAATRELQDASRALTAALQRLRRRLGRAPDEAEIAAALGLTVEGYRAALLRLADAGLTTLEALDFDAAAASLARSDEEPSELPPRPDLREAVAEAIEDLPPRLQHVLALRYQHACTPREVAAVLGIDEARAEQLRCEAVHRLRAAVTTEALK